LSAITQIVAADEVIEHAGKPQEIAVLHMSQSGPDREFAAPRR